MNGPEKGNPMTETAWMMDRYSDVPKLVTIIKRTAKMIFYTTGMSRREPFRTMDVDTFFPTWEAARSALVQRNEARKRSAEVALVQANREVARAMSLQDPTEPPHD